MLIIIIIMLLKLPGQSNHFKNTKYLIKIDRIFNYNCSNEWKMLTECLHGKTSFEQNQLMEILAENLSLIGNVNLKVFISSFIDFSFK